ncbi:MAG: CPBP family intramembrane glutamic endopeptidase [Victivallaceae bacterium]
MFNIDEYSNSSEKYLISLRNSVIIYFGFTLTEFLLVAVLAAQLTPERIIYWTIVSNWVKIFLVLLPWAEALRQGDLTPLELGFGALSDAGGRRNLRQMLLLGVVLLLTVDFISILNNLLMQVLQFKIPENTVIKLFTQGSAGIKIAVAFLALVTAPVCEEIFFRNILFKFIRDVLCRPPDEHLDDFKRRTWIAAVGASSVFAVIHLNFYGFIPLLCLGLLFQYLFIRSKSLWPSIIIHALNNLQALLIAFL